MSETADKPKTLPLDTVIERYVKMRDKKAEMKAEYEKAVQPYTEAMERLENAILESLNSSGVESVRTTAGTAYKSRSVSVTVADKESFRNFIQEQGAWELADLRASKTAVEEYRQEHDDIPPGLNYKAAITIGVRRS